MKKYQFLLVLLALLLIRPGASSAFSVISESDPGGIKKSGPYYHSGNDEIRIDLNGRSATEHNWKFYSDPDFTKLNTDKTKTASAGMWYTAVGFNCVGYYDSSIRDGSGNVLYSIKLAVSAGDLQNPRCDSGSDSDKEGSGDGDDGGSCDACAVLECPGWQKYMGKLDDIKNAIPPPPNWQSVSETFRDTIAPRLKSDLDDLLGRAPEPPPAPAAPTPPAMPPDLDTRGLTEPTGQEAPGFDFNEKKIMDEAPVIQEREDPTGGFTINNPIDMLPSQDDFKKNAPKEGTVPLPGAPKELENKAPTPPEGANAAPVPKEGGNKAPVPNESGTAPLPGKEGGNAPLPSESGTAPVPGADASRAPIPGG